VLHCAHLAAHNAFCTLRRLHLLALIPLLTVLFLLHVPLDRAHLFAFFPLLVALSLCNCAHPTVHPPGMEEIPNPFIQPEEGVE